MSRVTDHAVFIKDIATRLCQDALAQFIKEAGEKESQIIEGFLSSFNRVLSFEGQAEGWRPAMLRVAFLRTGAQDGSYGWMTLLQNEEGWLDAHAVVDYFSMAAYFGVIEGLEKKLKRECLRYVYSLNEADACQVKIGAYKHFVSVLYPFAKKAAQEMAHEKGAALDLWEGEVEVTIGEYRGVCEKIGIWNSKI